ncbi:RidA family protein [Streptomyces fungicidicus]|uniref:RidA family protein n=1 Tax=Streptomyces fungicidicus TaxID=68203 RepID=UPI00368D9C55
MSLVGEDRVTTSSGRKLVSGGSRFESVFGYSRAVRVGPFVSVAGSTAMTANGPVGGDDVLAQTREALRRIEVALEDAGASLQDVMRTRVFVTDIREWEKVGQVHSEYFGHIRPASTIVEVSALVDPSLLVEIEADALVNE